MPEPGEDVLLLTEGLGLSDTTPDTDDPCVFYGTDGRGESTPNVGQSVAVVNDALGQGPSGGIGGIVIEDLVPDSSLLYIGDTTTLRANTVNNNDEDVLYTVDFQDSDGTIIGSEEQTIPSRGSYEYTTDLSRGSAQEVFVTANGTNETRVTFMNVRPGDLTASTNLRYLEDTSQDVTLSIPVENPGDNAVTVSVTFLEDGSSIASEEVTIDPGDTYTYETTVAKQSVGQFVYQARVTQQSPLVTGFSNEVTVAWVDEDNEAATIRLSGRVDNINQDTSFGASWEAGNGATQRFNVFRIDYGGQYTSLVFNDDPTSANDYDFDDCLISFDQRYYDSEGYMTVEIWHASGTGPGHRWQVEGFTHEHDSSGDGPGNPDRPGTQKFAGRFYTDGDVTDLNGNSIGSWK